MRVLYVSSECSPFIQNGELANVSEALPKALAKSSKMDVSVILPLHGKINSEYLEMLEEVASFSIKVGDEDRDCTLKSFVLDNVTYYFVENDYYFSAREGDLYGHYDDGERFIFFDKAVVASLDLLKSTPQVIHCNDWHTGLIPFFHKQWHKDHPVLSKIKTVLTIHNIEYQGIYSLQLDYLLNLPKNPVYEFHGNFNFLKAGLMSADEVITVSDTYSNEVLYSYFAFGLESITNYRKDDLIGILNGVDYAKYNPNTCVNIAKQYNGRSFVSGKQANKLALQKSLGLPIDSTNPIIAMVCPFTEQKGIDLLDPVFEYLLHQNSFQFVVYGQGDDTYENYFRYLENKFPNNVRAIIDSEQDISSQIYAGADFLLMPSRIEPSGVNQLIALKFGTLPIVHETGGLKDSILPFNEYTLEGNGFSFANYNAHEMMNTINYAIKVYQDKPAFKTIIRNALRSDYSFEKTAKEYKKIYRQAVK